MSTTSLPRLIVGLGNPGAEYSETRHNAGFWFCERLAQRLGARFSFENRYNAYVAALKPGGPWLLMPQTYMNRSGQAVGSFARFYRIQPGEMLVVHDELDIPPGQLRLKFGGGLGGHNGLKDITAHCQTQDYWRLRIGIGHPGDRNQVAHFVLKPAQREEQRLIDEAIDRALDSWPDISRGEWNQVATRLNARPANTPQSKDESKS